MDINTIRIWTTLLSFVLFIAIIRWTWSKRRKADFSEAEQLPFATEEGDTP